MPMYCQCGFGNRINDAARVSQGRIGERESAENMRPRVGRRPSRPEGKAEATPTRSFRPARYAEA